MQRGCLPGVVSNATGDRSHAPPRRIASLKRRHRRVQLDGHASPRAPQHSQGPQSHGPATCRPRTVRNHTDSCEERASRAARWAVARVQSVRRAYVRTCKRSHHHLQACQRPAARCALRGHPRHPGGTRACGSTLDAAGAATRCLRASPPRERAPPSALPAHLKTSAFGGRSASRALRGRGGAFGGSATTP